jgi:DNA polymerase III alpha subunit/intein/homing endonuclease
MPVFSHLHCHTQYSLLDGQASIGALMKKAQADGMPAVALTDHGNMFGAFNFVAEANKYNVKPIVGCEFYLVEDRHKKSFSREKGERDVRHHQLLLAKDQAGYQNLAKLCSMSFIEGVYSKYPRIDKELLLQYHEGLIATSCCIGAEIPQALLWKSEEEAEELLKWWLDLFGADYYLEIQRHGLKNIDNTGKNQEDLNQILLKWARKYNVKVICTNDSHYVDQTDFAPHDLLLCVNTGEEHSIPVGDFQTKYFRLMSQDSKVLYDHLDNLRPLASSDDQVRRQLMRIDEEAQMPKPRARFGFPNDQFYFKTQEEMNRLFEDVPESVDNTNEIVDKITPPTLQRDILLPNFPLPPEYPTADAFLRHLTFKGAFEGPKPRYSERTPEIEERLNYELRVIETMGFAGYFLITQDFINKGRDMGVAVGPGRGSAAGSAVAYCVGITNIDPIKYSLLFERFLNPERVSMPDIDIDFDDVNRQKVIDYVVQKYGKTQVAQIITFGTMAAKSSIKDVARAMELPLPATNELAKMVPEQVGTTLLKAFTENQELDMIRRDEAPDNLRGQILRLAEKLEGSVRNTGIHAAGVIIAPDDITKYIPVSTSKDSDLLVTQFDGKVIESAGMLKMDFLGLKTLTIIVDALALIEKNHGVKIDIDNIPIDDPKTYELYQRGDTIGTFQFESEGMRMYLKDLKPTNIEDLIAMNALYRPGPMQFIPNFINRKHGREPVEYPHELLEPILNYSQGIMVYQEQIMQAAQILAGYSLGGADLLRRAMGKKDMKKMAQEREKFVAGAKKLHNIPAKKASEVFDVMEKFAAYGFNRCLTGDTVVHDACTGRRWTMAEIYRHRPSDLTVYALGEDEKLHPRAVTDVFDNGIKPVFEVVTRQGKRLRATANHPLRTVHGWTLLQELRSGDRIAAPRHIRTAATATWPAYQLVALAGLISEGNTCHPGSLYFFSNDFTFIEDFAVAIRQFPDTVARIYQRPDARQYEVCANTGRSNHAGSGSRRSGAYQWAKTLGITGKKATEKTIPAAVFELCDADLCLLLGRLWAGDGFIANHQEHTPWYATSSRQLAFDVQTLLLRLGIQSSIHTKRFRYRATLRPGYTVRLIGVDAVERFLTLIAPHCLSREAAVEKLRAYVAATERGLTSKDTIPHQYARQLVIAERATSGFPWKRIEAESGVSMREFTGRGSHVKQAFRRSTLGRLADYFNSATLRTTAENDIFWDEIVSITPCGEEQTYDLTVADDHNFIANGLVVHNSHSAAYSVVAYQTGYLKANYPAEYMAAVLTNNMSDIKKVTFFIEEARRQGVPVLGPDVNESILKFNVNEKGQIRFGMAAVKGAGEAAIESIVQERDKKGPYTDIFDFSKRVNLRAVNKKTFESLALSGAFDSFERYHRRQFVEAPGGDQNLIDKAVRMGQQYQAELESAQQSLFGGGAFGAVAMPLPKVPEMEPWPATELLRREKEVVGFYLSGHPLDDFKLEIDSYCTCGLDKVENYKNREVTVAGLISNVLFKTTKTGQPFVSFNVEDYESSLNLALFRDDYSRFSALINPRNYDKEQVPPMYIRGKYQQRFRDSDQFEFKILAMEPLFNVAEKLANGVRVQLDLRTITEPFMDRFMEAVEGAAGSKKLEIKFAEPHEHLTVDTYSRRYRIEPKEFIRKMREMEIEACQLI